MVLEGVRFRHDFFKSPSLFLDYPKKKQISRKRENMQTIFLFHYTSVNLEPFCRRTSQKLQKLKSFANFYWLLFPKKKAGPQAASSTIQFYCCHFICHHEHPRHREDPLFYCYNLCIMRLHRCRRRGCSSWQMKRLIVNRLVFLTAKIDGVHFQGLKFK